MRLIRLIRDTGIWAPALVLVLHEVLQSPQWRDQIDWFNHFSGGLSFSFFVWKTLPFFHRLIGELTAIGRLGVAFLAGCTAALIWEIIEFSSDLVFHTHIQHSICETMMDIVNGFLGTCVTTTCAIVIQCAHRRKHST